MQQYLKRLDYGNQRTGSIVDLFWLDGPLEISAVEQARFVARLAQQALPLSPRSQSIVRDILRLEEGGDAALYGKTGWIFQGTPQFGWWTGWVEKRGKIYAFALNIDMTSAEDAPKRIALGPEPLIAARHTGGRDSRWRAVKPSPEQRRHLSGGSFPASRTNGGVTRPRRGANGRTRFHHDLHEPPSAAREPIFEEGIRTRVAPGMEVVPRHSALARERVRYAGEPVAVVAAETAYAADDVLAAITVVYEKLPAVADQEAATQGARHSFTTRWRATLPISTDVPEATSTTGPS